MFIWVCSWQVLLVLVLFLTCVTRIRCIIFTCVADNRCTIFICVAESMCYIDLCTLFICVLSLSLWLITGVPGPLTIFTCVLYLPVYYIYLWTKFTCVAENRCPWYLLMTVNCLTSLSSNQATGVRKSRGLARPLAPTENWRMTVQWHT